MNKQIEEMDFKKIIINLLIKKLNKKLKNSIIKSEVEIKDIGQIADIGVQLENGKWIYFEIQEEANVQFFIEIAKRDQKTNTNTIPLLVKPLIKKYKRILEESVKGQNTKEYKRILRLLNKELEIYVDEKKY